MVEEPVRLLQLVQVHRHLECGPVKVFGITGSAIRLQLHDDEHVHVVDPHASLRAKSVSRGVLPLFVRSRLSQIEIFLLLGQNVDFKWHCAKDCAVHMVRHWDEVGFLAKERLKPLNKP